MNPFTRIRGGVNRLRDSRIIRYLTFSVSVAAALLAAAIVVSVTVDLGPAARSYAEKAG